MKCTVCGQEIPHDFEREGQVCTCPRCGEQFRMPALVEPPYHSSRSGPPAPSDYQRGYEQARGAAAFQSQQTAKGCAIWILLSAILAIGGPLLLFACCAGIAANAPPVAPAPPQPQSPVTLDNFLRVKNGMTFDEVCAVLGNPSTMLADSEIAGIRTVMFQWNAAGFGGANCNVTLQNGRVIAKAQFGLR